MKHAVACCPTFSPTAVGAASILLLGAPNSYFILVRGRARGHPRFGIIQAQRCSCRQADVRWQMLAESLPLEITAFGWLAWDEQIALPSRHLGLVQGREIGDPNRRI